MEVSALRFRDYIHIFQSADVIHGEKSVGKAGGIAPHPALIVAPKKAVHIEFREIYVLFLIQKQILYDRLLNAHQPGSKRVNRIVQRLVFDVAESRPFQALDHMRRNTEDAADFLHPEFPRREKLAVLRWQGNRFVRHPLF